MNKRIITQIAGIAVAVAILLTGCSGKKADTPATPKLTAEEAPKVRDQAVELITGGKLDEAQNNLKAVTNVTPKDPRAQFLLGLTYYNKKQYAEAIAAYQVAINLDPKMVEAYNNTANAYRDMQKTDEAVTWYQKAIAVNPMFSYPYTNLAELYIGMGKRDEAIKLVEQGIAANPANMDLRIYLAGVYKDADQKDKAIQTLEQALKANPNYGPATKLLADLKK